MPYCRLAATWWQLDLDAGLLFFLRRGCLELAVFYGGLVQPQ
jgi:hypothetical protein